MVDISEALSDISPLDGDIAMIDGIEYQPTDMLDTSATPNPSYEVEFVVVVNAKRTWVRYIIYYDSSRSNYCSFHNSKCYNSDDCSNNLLRDLLFSNIPNLEQSLITNDTPTISRVKRIIKIHNTHNMLMREEAGRVNVNVKSTNSIILG